MFSPFLDPLLTGLGIAPLCAVAMQPVAQGYASEAYRPSASPAVLSLRSRRVQSVTSLSWKREY